MADGLDFDESISKINIVPFVDIVLVLLVIFMISAPTIYSQATRVALPKIFNAMASDQITFRLSLDNQGVLRLDRRPVTLEELPKLYKEAKAIDPQLDAVVEADESLSFKKVMEVVSVLQKLGIENVAIGGVPLDG